MMERMNLAQSIRSLKENFVSLPPEYKKWSGLGVLLALLVALPITIWGLNTSDFQIEKRAATGEVTPTPIIFPTPTPIPENVITISTIDMTYQKKDSSYDLSTKVQVVKEATRTPIASARVSLEITKPDGTTQSFSALTKKDGVANFSLRTKETGVYQAMIVNVVKAGFVYHSTLITKTLTVF